MAETLHEEKTARHLDRLSEALGSGTQLPGPALAKEPFGLRNRRPAGVSAHHQATRCLGDD